MRKFEDLEIWQSARIIVNEISKLIWRITETMALKIKFKEHLFLL